MEGANFLESSFWRWHPSSTVLILTFCCCYIYLGFLEMPHAPKCARMFSCTSVFERTLWYIHQWKSDRWKDYCFWCPKLIIPEVRIGDGTPCAQNNAMCCIYLVWETENVVLNNVWHSSQLTMNLIHRNINSNRSRHALKEDYSILRYIAVICFQ